MRDLKDLLEQWSRWLVKQKEGDDAPSDPDGSIHTRLNRGNPVWFLAGTWGGRPVQRTLTVPSGTSIFIVPAFSCANNKILIKPRAYPEGRNPKLPNTIERPTKADLLARVNATHKLFHNVHVTIDGFTYGQDQLDEVETDMFFVDVAGNGHIAKYYGYPGLQSMVGKGYVMLLESVISPHTIRIQATGDEDTATGEPECKIDVNYIMKVT